MTQLDTLAQQLAEIADVNDIMISTAESCTGGGLAEVITRVSGSSKWFDRGFVTYSNQAKMDMLGVHASTLDQHGAVSEQTAEEMATGALNHSLADIAVSITGVAGPTGGSPDKPVGTVCLAWANRQNHLQSTRVLFDGDRISIREQSALMAMQGIIELLSRA